MGFEPVHEFFVELSTAFHIGLSLPVDDDIVAKPRQGLSLRRQTDKKLCDTPRYSAASLMESKAIHPCWVFMSMDMALFIAVVSCLVIGRALMVRRVYGCFH